MFITIKTPEKCHLRRFNVIIVNFEQILYFFGVYIVDFEHVVDCWIKPFAVETLFMVIQPLKNLNPGSTHYPLFAYFSGCVIACV